MGCVHVSLCLLPTYLPQLIHYVRVMFEREDYDIELFINILMILQREYNEVVVPTVGIINKINKSYPHRTQTSRYPILVLADI